MSNNLKTEKKIQVISALCEGNSIRSTERMTEVHRDTIMRLGVKAGNACAAMLDKKMRSLEIEDIQIDEIWGYIGKKKQNIKYDDPEEFGDVYTMMSLDSQSKLIPNFQVGNRDFKTAQLFIHDLATRIKNRTQINSDGFWSYANAVKEEFGENVDYSITIKSFVENGPLFPHDKLSWRERDPKCMANKKSVIGKPVFKRISTSYVERQNLTFRIMNKRLNRLTICFSKKLNNFIASVGLYVAYYNFCRKHQTLKATPAQAYGMEQRQWKVADLVELIT